MNRNLKLVILVLCGMVTLVALLLFASGPGGRKSGPEPQSVVIAPDGKLTVTPLREGWGKMTLTIDQPKTKTNTSGTITNSNTQ